MISADGFTMSGTPGAFGEGVIDGIVGAESGGEANEDSVDCDECGKGVDDPDDLELSESVGDAGDSLLSCGSCDDVGEVSLHMKLKRCPMISASCAVDPAALS